MALFPRLVPVLHRYRGSLARLSRVMGSGLISRAAQLALMVIVARRLGPTDYGLFIFAIGTSAVAGMLGNLGWQFAFNRFFAIARRQADKSELRGLMRASGGMSLAGSLVAASVLVVAGMLTEELGFGLIAAGVLAIPYAGMLLRRQQLAGTGQPATALMLDQGLASLVLLAVVLSYRASLGEMLAVYGGALLAGNLGAAWLVRRKLPAGLSEAPARYDWRTWIRVSLTLMQARMAKMLLSRIDVVLLPVLASLTAAGIYGAAYRVTYLLTFPQFVLQTINGPQFAEAFASGRIDRVRRTLKLSIGFSLVTSLPWLILFVAVPETVMRFVFGQKFADGALPLVLISIGQFAMGLAIPFNSILIMSGNEKALVRLSYTILLSSLALAFVLIPPYGAAGAGTVTLMSGLALVGGQAWLARRALLVPRQASHGQAVGPEPAD